MEDINMNNIGKKFQKRSGIIPNLHFSQVYLEISQATATKPFLSQSVYAPDIKYHRTCKCSPIQALKYLPSYRYKYEWVVMNSWRLQFGIDIYIRPSDNLGDFWCEQFLLRGQKASTLFGI